ncbi:MAG TPA: hypothetical protein VFG52_04825 [Xanthomonadales bacterium]|nr:hypothetical protein [Xanthomonadales bacterium]
MNLLDHFMLQQVQLTLMHAELLQVTGEDGNQEAKVELNLAPRLVKTDSGDELPSYRVTARLGCESSNRKVASFRATVCMDALYQQTGGTAIDLAEFMRNNASLTRQLYPLLQAEMRQMLFRLGLQQIQLPFDLPPHTQKVSGQTIEFSGAVH